MGFVLAEQHSSSGQHTSTSVLGLLLLTGAVLCDSLNPILQEQLMQGQKRLVRTARPVLPHAPTLCALRPAPRALRRRALPCAWTRGAAASQACRDSRLPAVCLVRRS